MSKKRYYDKAYKIEAVKRAKEIKHLKEMNEFLEEASTFFATSRRRSGK